MRYVFARGTWVKFHPVTGQPVGFTEGQKVPADDPIVRASPDDFMSGDEFAGVEQATAAPGEKRSVRRP